MAPQVRCSGTYTGQSSPRAIHLLVSSERGRRELRSKICIDDGDGEFGNDRPVFERGSRRNGRPDGRLELADYPAGSTGAGVDPEAAEDGDQLMGVITDGQGRNGSIKDAKLKGSDISFRVEIERDSQKLSFAYKGKLANDVIKGTVTATIIGRETNFDFDGNRVKENTTLSGSWELAMAFGGRPRGQGNLLARRAIGVALAKPEEGAGKAGRSRVRSC